jgi:serine protease Do
MSNQSSRSLIIFLVILSFLSGIIGGIGALTIVGSSTTLQKSLGINGNGLPSVARQENITVKEDSAVIDAVKKDSPAVVSVAFTQDVQAVNPFGFPIGSGTVQQQGSGSGFVISSDGLIATNKHVADASGASYSVITSDGKKYDAKILALDPSFDFAILKIDAKNLPVIDFGDSDQLDVGQAVIAIGNALGEFQNTVTVGVLSGKERNLTASDSSGGSGESLFGLLQTDAAINAGNSGGPLLNLKGQIIGMNTATAAKGTAEGLGFAIPINSLKPAIDSVEKTGKIIRPYLGVMTVPVDQKVAASQNIDPGQGAVIVSDPSTNQSAVAPGSPADKIGLKEGDVILKINGNPINQDQPLISLISKYNPSTEITLTVLRNGKQSDYKVTLGQLSS